MAQAAQQFDSEPQRLPSLSPDEQRIANAVVAALQSELKPIKDTLEQHTQILEQHSKILANVQLELRDINKILAGAGLIIDDPDI